jgi:hypothetical protein
MWFAFSNLIPNSVFEMKHVNFICAWTGSIICVTSSPEEKCLHVGTGDAALIPKSLLLCRKFSNIEVSFKVCAWLLVVIVCACADKSMQCSMRACNGLLNLAAAFHTHA